MNTTTKQPVLFWDDLKKRFNRGPIILNKALKKCFKTKRSVTINGVETTIIKPVKRNYRLTLSLLNHPKAIDSFKDFCAEEGVLLNPKQKREGMLGATELYQQYSYPYAFFNKMLRSCYQERKTFEAYGKETPLVEMCLSGSQQILALNESKQALEIFKNVCASQNTPLICIKKQQGMLSASDLSKIYQKPTSVFHDLLQKCFDQKITFRVNGEQKPLVQEVKSGSVMILATNQHQEALPHLLRFAASNGILLKKTTKHEKSPDEFLTTVQKRLTRTEK